MLFFFQGAVCNIMGTATTAEIQIFGSRWPILNVNLSCFIDKETWRKLRLPERNLCFRNCLSQRRSWETLLPARPVKWIWSFQSQSALSLPPCGSYVSNIDILQRTHTHRKEGKRAGRTWWGRRSCLRRCRRGRWRQGGHGGHACHPPRCQNLQRSRCPSLPQGASCGRCHPPSPCGFVWLGCRRQPSQRKRRAGGQPPSCEGTDMNESSHFESGKCSKTDSISIEPLTSWLLANGLLPHHMDQ